MAVEFERGAFENPDDPVHFDDVDSSIVVVTAPEDRDAAARAVERSAVRWRGIDGAGRYHTDDDMAFWQAQPDHCGDLEWHTANYFSEVELTAAGVEIDVDCKSVMPAPMREAYRQVLVEELAADGVNEAVVRSRYAEDYEPLEEPPEGDWPPFPSSAVRGLPPGSPPGHVIHTELRRTGGHTRNALLQRDVSNKWEAAAVATTDATEDDAVRETARLFAEAGWQVGEPTAAKDWDGHPMVATGASMPRGIAVISSKDAKHARSQGLPVPSDAKRVINVVAYYDID